MGDACQFSALIQIGTLLTEADFHARFPVYIVAVPIGNVVLWGAGRNRTRAINPTEILGLGGKTGVLSAADHKDRANRPYKPRNCRSSPPFHQSQRTFRSGRLKSSNAPARGESANVDANNKLVGLNFAFERIYFATSRSSHANLRVCLR